MRVPGNDRLHGGADVAIGLAVDDRSFATAYSGLRRGGRLVLVALPASGTLRLPVFDTVLNGTSVIGSIVGTRADSAGAELLVIGARSHSAHGNMFGGDTVPRCLDYAQCHVDVCADHHGDD